VCVCVWAGAGAPPAGRSLLMICLIFAKIDGGFSSSNFQMSTMTPKIVMFTMDISEAPSSVADATNDDGSDASHNKLEDMIKELSTALTGKYFGTPWILGGRAERTAEVLYNRLQSQKTIILVR
jgi:hypothetical protein